MTKSVTTKTNSREDTTMVMTTSGSSEPQRNPSADSAAAAVYGAPGQLPDATRMAREDDNA
jgi:hypothetical protein